MGSLILCHNKRARQPYEITRVHKKVHTIEELCYYICNNLYLIDHTIMNRRLCDWIESELGMVKLAGELRNVLLHNSSQEHFILAILKGSYIYGVSEINKIQALLEKLKNQKEVERAKFKADSLMRSGEYEDAVLVYLSIVNGKTDETVGKEFYGRVYACLGAAYGQQFLYKEAAGAYKQAVHLYNDADILEAYLYCCMQAYPMEEYVKMLSGNSLYLNADAALKEILKNAKFNEDWDVENSQLEDWKKEYRRIDKKSRVC